jgi:hypothetical protein
MRSSLVIIANAEIAIVLGSIPASSDTVESKRATDDAALNTVHREKKIPKIPLLFFRYYIVRYIEKHAKFEPCPADGLHEYDKTAG